MAIDSRKELTQSCKFCRITMKFTANYTGKGLDKLKEKAIHNKMQEV
jgi:hypothetical protein